MATPNDQPPSILFPGDSDRPDSALRPTTEETLAAVAQRADQIAEQLAIVEYLDRKAPNTIRTHSDSLKRFAAYLDAIGETMPIPQADAKNKDATKSLGADMRQFARAMLAYRETSLVPAIQVWRHVSHGLVKGFREWMKAEGDAVSTINARLSALKVIAGVAFESGLIDETTIALIRAVKGYSRQEAKRVDERRAITRRGTKKAAHTPLSEKQAEALKDQPDTPQGRRDRLLLCLLIDHGLRVGEIAALTVGDFNLADNTLSFYREKVNKDDVQELSRDTASALLAYMNRGDVPLAHDALLLRSSKKSGELTAAGMSTRAMTKRVKKLGEKIGVEALSAHDCRHYWATYWGKRVERLPKGLFTLQEAGGWASLTMPRRYVEQAQVSNEGMV